jgi:tetratricopeptide (TPR) repeat protein
MLEAEIRIEEVGGAEKRWRVELDGAAGRRSESVLPLVDADLAEVDGLVRDARTWQGLVNRLSPSTESPWRISLPALEQVGTVIRRRLLGWDKATAWLQQMAAKARSEARQLRFVIELDPSAERLWDIPLELAFDGTDFLFKRRRQPTVRCDPDLEWVPRVAVARGDRLVIATAHEDGRDPSRDALRAHAAALCQAAERAGLRPVWIEDATAAALEAALTSTQAEPIDVLYIACHGAENADHRGQLALRGGALKGTDLARWAADHADRARPLKAALLSACSSATRGASTGTSSMAQWLLQRGKSLVTMGHRGPVAVGWALSFTERLFEGIGNGASIEEAFADVRASQPDDEPQWPLPLLFTRRWDVAIPSRRAVDLAPVARAAFADTIAVPQLRSQLPRAPRPYFTAREEELTHLRTWLKRPGRAVITAVAGEGGVGKTELATCIAYACHEAGLPVLWLERRDRDLRAAAIGLLEAEDPGFRATPELSTDDLTRRARERLRAHRGLMVLDDVASSSDVDALVPGGGWNVLVTTRTAGLLPGVAEVVLRPLDPADAVRLLSRVAWSVDEPPAAEAAGALALVERLGRLPLAIEAAGGTLRGEALPAAAYLEDLVRRLGPAAADIERVEAVSKRSLETLGVGARRVLHALAVLPAPGARLEMVATAVGEPEPRVARWLDRVVRHHLASFAPGTGRYGLHPLMREAMRAEATGDPGAWDRLHRGTAAAMHGLVEWIEEAKHNSIERALERWRAVRDLFDALDLSEWEQGEHGGERLAEAIARVDQLRQFASTPAARKAALDAAERLSHAGSAHVRGQVLSARGDLRLRQADLAGAAQDYDQALTLFQAVEDRLGQANVLQARGDLAQGQGELATAMTVYQQALELYDAIGDALGQSNVLAEVARVLTLASQPENAREAAERAAALAERAHNAYARSLAASILAHLAR